MPQTKSQSIATTIAVPGMARKIVMRDPKSLKPFDRNARVHSDRQVDKICVSIRRFGFLVPLLIDEASGNEIIAGHGRQLAALKMVLDRVPTINSDWLNEDERRAYRIADNKLTLDATWDDEILAAELADLDIGGFDLSSIGFSAGELKGMGIGGLGDGGDAGDGQVPERWAVIVDCVDEADQVALIARLEAEGRKVRGAVG